MATRGGGTVSLVAFLMAAVPALLVLLPRSLSPSTESGTRSDDGRLKDTLLSGIVLEDPGAYSIRRMCDEDGICHEHPAVATPRTVYSAMDKGQHVKWWKFHAALNITAKEYATRRGGDKGGIKDGRRPLILLGDSITESWLGTGLGEPRSRADGVPDVLDEFCRREKFDPLVAAVSGDQTQHLLYRMGHGQVLPEYADDPDALFVCMIGTNDLGSGILPGPTAEGVLAVAEYVLKHTKGRLVLFELLPRGDAKFKFLPDICPPRCDKHGKPFSSFGPAVDKVNRALREATPKLSEKYGGRMSLVDCGESFVPKDGGGPGREVREDLMPDLLHPNAEGHRLLADCLVNCAKGKC